MSSEFSKIFTQGVEDGSIKKHLMSEDVPEKNDEAVFVIVGKNYEETVYAEDKAGICVHSIDYLIISFRKIEISNHQFSLGRILRPLVWPLQIPWAYVQETGRALCRAGWRDHRQIWRDGKRIRRRWGAGIPHHQILPQGSRKVHFTETFLVGTNISSLLREVIDYEGGRDLDSMIKFVESGGTEGNEPADDVSIHRSHVGPIAVEIFFARLCL